MKRWSLNLGKVFGIRVLVHWTFFLLIAWVVFAEWGRGSEVTAIVMKVIFVLSIFACVVLHELGHALMARRYKIVTRQITLLPIGGVASLERIPEEPKKELLVAIAGPLVNVAIAVIIYPFISSTNFEQYAQSMETITFNNFLFALFAVNLFIVAFNLIPAFPMDGGRMLRAVLAMFMDRIKATFIASSAGKLLAFGFLIIGLFYNPWLALIGLFVFFGAHAENAMVQQIEILRGHTVSEAMMTKLEYLDSESTVEDGIKKLLDSDTENFLVTADGNAEVKGIVSRKSLIEALQQGQSDHRVTEIMRKDFEKLAPKDKLSKVFMEIQRKKQPIYPVMENGELKGAVSMPNIQEFIMVQSAMH